jgi:hypothetical protein
MGGTSSSGGTAGSASAQEGTPISSAEGAAELIDLFMGQSGIYVVDSQGVRLLDRAGNQLASVTALREITAAAFGDGELVVTDRAKFTTYDLDLNELGTGTLVELCAAAVMVSDDRFVCGPTNDWDRVFYTYDRHTGELVASSLEYTYNGIPMGRVPGTDDFVTVTVDSSPSDFHLYSVESDGTPVYVNESPYHGDFRVTSVYAFDGAPPEHLVTDAGLLLRIYGEGCDASESSFTAQCFEKDGDLGALSGSQLFMGMDSDDQGRVYGLVDPTPSGFSPDPVCAEGCLLERIDVASRSIEAKSIVHLAMGQLVSLRHDPSSHGVAIGYRLSTGDHYFAGDPYPGYAITYFGPEFLP